MGVDLDRNHQTDLSRFSSRTTFAVMYISPTVATTAPAGARMSESQLHFDVGLIMTPTAATKHPPTKMPTDWMREGSDPRKTCLPDRAFTLCGGFLRSTLSAMLKGYRSVIASDRWLPTAAQRLSLVTSARSGQVSSNEDFRGICRSEKACRYVPSISVCEI